MGCDIHGVFQRKVNDVWEDVKSTYDFGRHYSLFSVLAGVRSNGLNECISEPRGFPDDFYVTKYTPGPESKEDPDDYSSTDYHPIDDVGLLSEWRQKYFNPKEDMLAIWMGDHSFSWLTSTEMLLWRDTNQALRDTGVISREMYESWDKTDAPDHWCGGIYGHGIIVVDEYDEIKNQDWTHIRCSWNTKVHHLDYFFDEVRRLHEEHGEVRFVFGFDN